LSGAIYVRFNGAANRVYLQVRAVTDGEEKKTSRALIFFIEGDGAKYGGHSIDGAEASGETVERLKQELEPPGAAALDARGIGSRQRGIARRQRRAAVHQ
jgi:hypothetical protein